jgi:hypothetical protein
MTIFQIVIFALFCVALGLALGHTAFSTYRFEIAVQAMRRKKR